MKFVDTDKTLGAMVNASAMYHAEDECRRLEAKGWTAVPDWFPAGIDGYDYRFPGNWWAYMNPKPKLRHILRYKFIPNWWLSLKAKLWVKQTLKELKK